MKKNIFVKGARTHNLKNINIEIPRNKMVTITGLSGSGKSSLAFDTIFAEGQRRYMESLSAYARQFLSMMDKPDVDSIDGLSPAISIEQKSSSHNPRSTVGTVTEIYDYLRLLFARIGTPKCPVHKISLDAMSNIDITEKIINECSGHLIFILAPIINQQKGEHANLIRNFQQQGYMRIRLNNEIINLADKYTINPKKKNNIELVVDRIEVKDENKLRISESLKTTSEISDGIIQIVDSKSEKIKYTFSTKHSCPHCGYSVNKLEPRLFSFNSPMGACEACDGLGMGEFIDENKLIVNKELSLTNGAVAKWDKRNDYYHQQLKSLAKHYGVNIEIQYRKLPKSFTNILMHGSGDEKINITYGRSIFTNKSVQKNEPWQGLTKILKKSYDHGSFSKKNILANYLSTIECEECNGSRLNKKARNIFIADKSINQITALTIQDSYNFFNNLKLKGMKKEISTKIINEIQSRLKFLIDVGLNYLTLNRTAETLSGGEGQRIRLASQIGSGLVGVMYILDEPTIGLHQRDNNRLLKTLKNLKDLGNTVIVVEHDEDTILSSDHIVDVGPGAGEHGGEIVFSGSPKNITSAKKSYTGQYISGERKISIPKKRRKINQKKLLSIKKAHKNNLKNIDVDIPIGLFTCITGVSGSGKSTLVDLLYEYVYNEISEKDTKKIECQKIIGVQEIDSIIDISQSPIGRTPRSNPVTYTGIFKHIRDLFTQTKESKSRGYSPGRFSFNVQDGSCETCSGDGVIKVEMHFLSDIYIRCEKCNGKRYNKETLEITFKGKNISDVLDFTVSEAIEFFQNIPLIKRKLEILEEVGLSYIKLGQSATTLSGGEAQRIKLSKELIKRDTGKTLYVLDEPTTGLHFYDVERLLSVLHKLRDRGNTLVVIEHNLDVIKTSDWIIDLGPEGGFSGGDIIGSGNPEEISRNKLSYTGKYLKLKLN
ncbi:MAG: excinuclease ABC subunit A [Gammaproteobacteria bacterium]|nr:excinuclease ABC subunit A [Gammaproteobacteria bacterium]|tara:strand:- start:37428 stop:40250 length:2823 start_codon:yes stop_codon:yes gene_type:complete